MLKATPSRRTTVMPSPRGDVVGRRAERVQKPMPLRIARTPSDSPTVAKENSWLDTVISIVSHKSFALRRPSANSQSAPPASPASMGSVPPTPGLEDSIAVALFTQSNDDAGGDPCKAYEKARALSRTTSQEYKDLVNDLWVDPATGLKASCLTHAIMSGNQAVAELLEAHGAEESYVYPATAIELSSL